MIRRHDPQRRIALNESSRKRQTLLPGIITVRNNNKSISVENKPSAHIPADNSPPVAASGTASAISFALKKQTQ